MRSVADLLRVDAETYDRKAADYAEPNDPFKNFREAEQFRAACLRGREPSCEVASSLTLIGLKLSRLKNIGVYNQAKNESVLDTLGDLRVYLAILEAQLRKELVA